MKAYYTLTLLSFLAITAGGQNFTDNFTRSTSPGPIDPWRVQAGTWATADGVGVAGPNAPSGYAYAWRTNTFTNCTVEGRIRFSPGAYGGGLGARLDPANGARYAAWVYPESSGANSNVVKLVKFSKWATYTLMQQASLTAVGTNWHTLRLTVISNRLSVHFDSALVISTTDALPYVSGSVSMELWTDPVPYTMYFDDVIGTVAGVAPVANPDAYVVVKGRTLSVTPPGVLGNDTGGAGPLTAVLVGNATNGTLSLGAGGGFTYTPSSSGQVGDSFTYHAADGVTNSAPATVGITFRTNTAPIAVADHYYLTLNSTLMVPGPGVLANDSDAEGDVLAATLIEAPARGVVSLGAGGGFSYVPPAHFAGSDRFKYRANDGLNDSASVTVDLSVWAIGSLFFDDFSRGTDPGPLDPWQVHAGGWTATGGALQGTCAAQSYGYIYLTNVWANYAVEAYVRVPTNAFGMSLGGRLNPVNGAHYAAWLYPGPMGGSLKLFKFQGWETYSYNGVVGQAIGQATLPFIGGGFHKVKLAFHGRQIAVYYDGERLFSVIDNEAVPLDVGGTSLGVWRALEAYSVTADDVAVSSLVSDDSYTVEVDTSLSVVAPGVMVNDTAVFEGGLVASVVTPPGHGALTLAANGGFTYTPLPGYVGLDTFTYAVVNGTTSLGTGTVTLEVKRFNHEPILAAQIDRQVAELSSLVVTNSATDPDVPANSLSYSLIDPPAGAVIDGSGVITWTPTELQGPGTNILRTRVVDDGEPPMAVTNAFTVTVLELNLPPSLPEQVDREMAELTSLVVTNSAFDADLPLNSISYALTEGPVNASISADGVISWMPTEAQGPSTNHFIMVTCDNGVPAYFATNSFTVVVREINAAPVLPAQPDRLVAPLTALLVTNTAADPDIPLNQVFYQMMEGPTNAWIGADGIIHWTPTLQQNDTRNVFRVFATDSGMPPLSCTNSFVVCVSNQPIITVESAVLAQEGCLPANGTVDAGERVTVVYSLRNSGTQSTTNLTATLLATGGVVLPTPPQAFGVIVPGGATVAQAFSFTADGICGGEVRTVLELHDGEANLGRLTNSFGLGWVSTVLTQAFDTVSVPALPAGWTSFPSGSSVSWVTQSSGSDTPPNVAHTGTPSSRSSNALVSAAISLPLGESILTFRHRCDLEAKAGGNGYDGAVLEIKIGQGSFVDIVAAGGMFLSGGYTHTISPSYHSPIAGRHAWSGVSSGFVTTELLLPAAAGGQTIQLRWMCAADDGGTAGGGWWVDSIRLVGRVCCGNTAPVLVAQPDRTVAELSELVVVNAATDASTPAEALTYRLIDPPAGAQIDASGTIRWVPTEAQGPGTTSITTVVSDNGYPPLSATNTFGVTVTEMNQGPVLPSLPGIRMVKLFPLVVTNRASDSDLPANGFLYSLLQAPAGAQIDVAGVITWTPDTVEGSTTNEFTTVVTDSGVPPLSATNRFTVVVEATNFPPVLPAHEDVVANELEPLVITNTAADSGLLSYVLVDPPAGVQIDETGVIRWTPSEEQGPGTNWIVTVVTDDVMPFLSATNTIQVVVSETNEAPVLSAIQEQAIWEGMSVSISNAATDVDVPVNSLSYALVEGPPGSEISTNGVITWNSTEWDGGSTNTFQTVVTDDGVPPRSATNIFRVAILETNSAPMLPVLSDRELVEEGTLTVWNGGADADLPADGLWYSLTIAPAGAGIDGGGVITWNPTEAQGPSTNLFETVLTDDGIPPRSVTNRFLVVVLESNTAPVLASVADREVLEGSALYVTNRATDADLPANTLNYFLSVSPPGAEIDAGGVISWVPPERVESTTNVFETVVTDGGVPPLSATNLFQVVVLKTNSAPVLPAIGDFAVVEGTSVRVTNNAVDVDLPVDSLSYQLVIGPAGAQISANGLITWEPGEAEGPSTNVFETVVLDDGEPPLGATNRFEVVVLETNSPPLLALLGEVEVVEGLGLTVTNAATDADIPANVVSYSLVIAPAGAEVDGYGVIRWTPLETQAPSTNAFETVATDDGSPPRSMTNRFQVIALESNDVPVLPVIANSTVIEGLLLTVTNTATDADVPENILTYALLQAPPGAGIGPQGVITWTPAESDGGSIKTFKTVVSDNGIPPRSATNTFQITVLETNTVPVLLPQANIEIAEGLSVTVTNSATDSDLPSNTLSYSLAVGPAGAAIDTAGVIRWTPTEAQGPSTNLFRTIVADNGSPQKSTMNEFWVVVLEVNSAPELPTLSGLRVVSGTTVLVTNRATDGDLPANGLLYALTAGPAGAVIDENGVITWVASLPPATNLLTTVVTDNGTPPASATNSFEVAVVATNRAPVLPVIAEIKVTEGTALTVTNTASDSDVPADLLTYRLLAAPAGAQIDTNGVVRWTPTEAQGPSTNVFETLVTDDVLPAGRATNTFRVVVSEVNSAPVLPVQPNFTNYGLNPVVVTNTATDADLPANSLTYLLISGPANAVIDAQGIITWTPTMDQIPSECTFSTLVVDLNPYATVNQRLSAANEFRVSAVRDPVWDVPVLHHPVVTDEAVVLTWSALDGRTYRVEFKEDLGAGDWTAIPPDVIAWGNTGSVTNALGGATRKFYRVVLLPE